MDRDFAIDVENCRITNEEASPDSMSCSKLETEFPSKACNGLASIDLSVKNEEGLNLGSNGNYGNKVCPEENAQVLIDIDKKVEGVVAADMLKKKTVKEKRKSMIAKKPPRPPRPPRGLSLDAADQKLIKEIAELAMLKRARIERMKALKKMKAAKASSSFSGSFFAMLLTVLFCVVLVCQGLSSRISSPVSFHGSLLSAGSGGSGFIMFEDQRSMSPSDSNATDSGSLSLVDHVSGLDSEDSRKIAAS